MPAFSLHVIRCETIERGQLLALKRPALDLFFDSHSFVGMMLPVDTGDSTAGVEAFGRFVREFGVRGGDNNCAMASRDDKAESIVRPPSTGP